MPSPRTLLLTLFCALLFAPPFVPALAQKKARPKAVKIKPAELDESAKILARFDGEQQMLINGLRYLMRPLYEPEVMVGRMYEPCPLPPFEVEQKNPMTLPETLRLWAILASGMPVTDTMRRELKRFIGSEHKRYNKSLAAYAVPMAVCVVALRRTELENAKELKALAADLMDTAMRVRELTAEESPLIKGMYIEPAWYANQMWRSLMCRCALELKIKFNENVWEAELKNVSHAAQKELGWISTRGGGRDGGNDLNSNLLALAGISLALSAPAKSLDKGVIDSLGKRLEYQPQLFTRLDKEYSAELLVGARLCLARSLMPAWAPEGIEPADWRYSLREKAVMAQFASGAVYTTHDLAIDMGLEGTMKAERVKPAIDTALACLSVCGGLFEPVEPPLKGLKTAEIETAMRAQSIQHANVLPEMPEGGDLAAEVEIAIDTGCAWLETMQRGDGSFAGPGDTTKSRQVDHPGVTGLAMLALMHGGMEPDNKVIEKGMGWVVGKVPSAIDNPTGQVVPMMSYDAGILLMMLQKYHEGLMIKHGVFSTDNGNGAKDARNKVWNSIPNTHRNLITKLVQYLDSCYVGGEQGGWNYGPNTKKGFGHSDHSISQYAGCGYKCASLLGGPVDVSVFETEANRLIAQYGVHKGEPFVEFDSLKNKTVPDDKEGDEKPEDRYSKGGAYEPKHFTGLIQAGGWGYSCGPKIGPTGTQYAGTGMALLAACRDELWARRQLPHDLHRKIDLHIFGAQLWLAKQMPKPEDDLERDEKEDAPKGKNARPMGGGGGWGGLYNWYAVERGCMMAGYELLHGGIDWYKIAARQIVDSQQESGTWGDVLGTSMAILVLRRASIPMITQPPAPEPAPPVPPPSARPKSPVTPGAIKKEPPPPKPVGPVTPGK